jgi:hypothetical protein
MRSSLVSLVTASAVAIAIAAASSSPSAQQRFEYVGPGQCLTCHDHDAERQWYEKKEILEVQRLFPAKGANAGHINSLKQLDTAKSDEFAKAIGLADKYDAKGACVGCHATVFGGDANAGVSCESCHGPASGYLKQHSVKGSYEQAVSEYGMTRLVGNLQGWTQQCTNCHVMDDDRLIKAGHPSGDDFDLSKRYVPVSGHFKKTYNAADVDSVAKGAMESILRRRRPNAAPPPLVATPAATPTPTATATVEPTPTATTAATPGRPRPAAPRPAPRVADAGAPPPGSPTSIEPPPPPPPVATPTASAPSPVTPATPESTPGLLGQPLVWVGAVAVLALLLFVLTRGRKK